MRAKRKRMLYIFFLLITVLLFFRSWETYETPDGNSSDDYAHKHHHGIHHKHKIKHHVSGHTVLHT